MRRLILKAIYGITGVCFRCGGAGQVAIVGYYRHSRGKCSVCR
jgi:hypothetical protein